MEESVASRNAHSRAGSRMHNFLAQDEDVSSGHESIGTSSSASPQEPPFDTQQLQQIPSSPPSPDGDSPASASTALANERQTVLVMLLGQVCSLHDATPRTFVVHVIALYEKGILDSNSIQGLIELGLVPRGHSNGLHRIGGGDDNDGHVYGGTDEGVRGENIMEATTTTSCSERDGTSSSERDGTSTCAEELGQLGAIVPYSAEAQQHPWTQYLPHASSGSSKSSSRKSGEEIKHSNNLHSKKMAHRQKEASAIRKHLERHESIDSTGSGYGSAVTAALPGIISGNAATTSAASSASSASSSFLDSSKTWNRAPSSVAQHSLTSADESFKNPSFRPYDNMRNSAAIPNNDEIPNNNPTQQLAANSMSRAASWSVENHHLFLSRYQREFHQLSLLATGSFGSVYHAMHKLEQRPYAVKCVKFSNMGYYANTLTLVMREVLCLAQLNHPNCVRYYTSWWEPDWMTGGQNDGFVNDDEDGEREEDEYSNVTHHHAPNDGKGNPKLLTDIERVIEGLHNNEEIDNSVEQLEAILYGGNDDDGENDMDDGFNWASSSQTQHSAFSFDRTEQNETEDDDWDNLPSHRTAGDESNVSEWTQELNNDSNRGSNSRKTQSFHNSQQQQERYQRQRSTELVPAGGAANANKNPSPQYKRQNSISSSSAAMYKYQTSLYIQMQLCNPSTLADWIKQRNGSCIDFDAEERQTRVHPAFEIFRQIVNGLVHVHSKGIVHRDLKPANIFSGDDGSFMIGDFGLSKMMKDANTHGVDIDNAIILPKGYTNGMHTAGVGTASYASPEQITTKTYSTAADIFSLGLILLELFSNFTSEHERAKAFHDCRHSSELAPWMKRYYPEVSALIVACTQADWSRRPSASDIQAAGMFQEIGKGAEIFRAELISMKVEMARKDDQIQNQTEQLIEKDKLIQSQTEQLIEKDAMIEDMRRRLAATAEARHVCYEVRTDAVKDQVGDDIDESSGCSSSDADY